MKAAALMELVARLHPHIDGNKRTTLTLMVLRCGSRVPP
ncbi:Fic family protein [bacterium RCC_150]